MGINDSKWEGGRSWRNRGETTTIWRLARIVFIFTQVGERNSQGRGRQSEEGGSKAECRREEVLPQKDKTGLLHCLNKAR